MIVIKKLELGYLQNKVRKIYADCLEKPFHCFLTSFEMKNACLYILK